MRNIVALVVAGWIYLAIWSQGTHSLTACLIPALILIGVAAYDTYLPLVKKTIHGDEDR
jgi:hypothetical protein